MRLLTGFASAGFFLLGALLFYGAITLALPETAATRSLSQLQNAVRTADAVEISVLSFPKAQERRRNRSFCGFGQGPTEFGHEQETRTPGALPRLSVGWCKRS